MNEPALDPARRKLVDAAGAAMRDVVRSFQTRPTGGDQFTRPQAMLLLLLAHHGEQPIKVIAERLQISSSAATQLVDGLADRQLVQRSDDLADRRVVQVKLSAAGRRIVSRLKHQLHARLGALLAPLSNDELTRLIQVLTKLSPGQQPLDQTVEAT